MNGKEKQKYLLQYNRVNRKFEASFQPKIKKALDGVVSSLIDDLRSKGIRQAHADLSQTILNQQLQKPLLAMYKEVGLFHGKQTNRRLKAEVGLKALGQNEQWMADIIRILRETLLEYATFGVSQTLRNHLLLVLSDGIQNELTVDELVKILQTDTFTRMQAERIVRTEVGRAANTGVAVASESFGFEMSKEWFAFRDQRTRGVNRKDKKDHYHMDGQTVDFQADFIDPRSGERIAYPMAPKGSAAMVINCRCTWAATPKRDANGRLIRKEKYDFQVKADKTEEVVIDIDKLKTDITEAITETISQDKIQIEQLVKSEVAKLDVRSEIEAIKEAVKSDVVDAVNQATNELQTSFHAFNRVNDAAIGQKTAEIGQRVVELNEVVKAIDVQPIVEVNTDSAEVISEIRDMRTDLVAGFMDLKMAINEKGDFEILFERDANGFLKSPIKVIRK